MRAVERYLANEECAEAEKVETKHCARRTFAPPPVVIKAGGLITHSESSQDTVPYRTQTWPCDEFWKGCGATSWMGAELITRQGMRDNPAHGKCRPTMAEPPAVLCCCRWQRAGRCEAMALRKSPVQARYQSLVALLYHME